MGYRDRVLETDLKWVNGVSVYHSNDKNISCGHLDLMVTEAWRAIEAPANIRRVLYKFESTGRPTKVAFLLISCHFAERKLEQNKWIYRAGAMLNDSFDAKTEIWCTYNFFHGNAVSRGKLLIRLNWAKRLKTWFTSSENNLSGSMQSAASHVLPNFSN